MIERKREREVVTEIGGSPSHGAVTARASLSSVVTAVRTKEGILT